MQRDLEIFTRNSYDILIIGGGINGACMAWEASLRGLSVALVEKTDFGSATSANSLKVIHGGLRYLQHADFKRARQSICERKTLMRIAPYLIHPLPVLIPTYGHGLKGKEILTLGLFINDLISFDRNWRTDPQKQIHRGRAISKRECLQLLPNIPSQDLTGGVVFYDAQVHNSERLPLAFLHSAVQAGADLANYVEVTGFIEERDRVIGVQAKDVLTDDQFEIRAKMVVNTVGPWINRVLDNLNGRRPNPRIRFAKAINVLTRPLVETYAVGISGRKQYNDADAVFNKGSRFFFIAPWRGQSLVGTEYIAYDGNPDELKVTESELQSFLFEINQAYPAANLQLNDITFVHAGLVPMSGIRAENGAIQLTKHHQIHDHRAEGLYGLLSVVGVKYTTARRVAEQVIDKVFEIREQDPPTSTSAVRPLYGGRIERFETFLQTEIKKTSDVLETETARRLILNYGSAYRDVLEYLDPSLAQTDRKPLAVLKAEVLHAVRQEMAQKLADIIFRRTELGSAGHPGDQALEFCAQVMSVELGWTQAKMQQELQQVNQYYYWTFGDQENDAKAVPHGERFKAELARSAL